MAAASSTTIVPQILDGEDDYKDWSVRVKTYLLSKDLWDVVETSGRPKFKAWRKNNAKALLAIQLSCGPRTFPMIRDKTTAKAAWDTLEAKFNREENSDDIRRQQYQTFFAAVRRGDLRTTKEIFRQHTDATTHMDSLGTALHNAVIFGHEKIVEELVKLMTDEELAIKDSDGWTALAYAARDNLKMVECMVTKNAKLVGIAEEGRQILPILIAAMYDRWDIVRYLYSHTEDLMADKGTDGSQLLVFCLFARQLDIAWELLMHSPGMACTRGHGIHSPLSAISSVPSAFLSGMSLNFWQRWIYKCIHVNYACSLSLDDSFDDFAIAFQNQENEQGNQRNITGISRIRELKLTHVRLTSILTFMCDGIAQLNHKEMRNGLVYEAVYSAVQNGTVEIVRSLCEARPELLFRGLKDGKNIFHYAVECRQENVYSLIYGVRQRNLITTLRDHSDNSILHYAGMLSPLAKEKLDGIAGAALQMQRERQWYKEVESIAVPLSGASTLNKDGLTPAQLFTEEHKELLEGGEKWMKSAAKSYTVVNALIITIMFAAAFTVPGGTNEDTGFPIFLNGKVFMVFIGSDAISLFSSATSALIFLGILTSRYAEDDFLKSLPTKMILGLSSLLLSIATMMVAFSSALFIMFQDKSLFTYPFIFLGTIPVTLFIWMQFPLLVKIFKSTYCERVFHKKIKQWI
ncbi:uncharacterized protein LOC126610483 isoform X4 [Malus sylvestris]|uniref:uncharacterized protein LOC126610483 isoform X4 n=1 Tax=Malus sylvestris TaxID=3752 RepID=UPI0021ACFC22|nr:uncharacterized protein LOC126610483 isoform X4 [Malus sylvestris]